MNLFIALVAALSLSAPSKSTADSRAPAPLTDSVKDFVVFEAPVVALRHVNVIDGTGSPARKNQTLVISGGRIESVGDDDRITVPSSARVVELAGRSVLPGLVGMHDHLFYTAKITEARHGKTEGPGLMVTEIAYSAPRLYLARGVTTIRTTGSVEPFTDLTVRARVEEGRMPGPKIHVTSPFLEGSPTEFAQMHELKGPDDARKFVEYWADQGVTSFKAYMHIKRADLSAAIQTAHKRGLKVTGHLCSIGYKEAAALGIDNLEHGFLVDSEFASDKKADVCPGAEARSAGFDRLDANGPEIKETIDELVRKKVAITSTLPVFELGIPTRPVLQPEILNLLLPEARNNFLLSKARANERATPAVLARFKKEMQLELQFARAGGLLLAGCDPTGMGGVIPGFADLREVELLVEAGFSPVEAIKIATWNGAEFLGESAHVGSIARGKQADLLVVTGDPSADIAHIQKVEMVFKDGVPYDSGKLLESVRGLVGLR